MLAYVFWHWPRSGIPVERYEDSLSSFQNTLTSHPPHGFRRSYCRRVTGAPWLPAGSGYEDWYLLDNAAALDSIGPGATTGTVAAPHDHVAAMSAGGTAGLYKPVRGEEILDSAPSAL